MKDSLHFLSVAAGPVSKTVFADIILKPTEIHELLCRSLDGDASCLYLHVR